MASMIEITCACGCGKKKMIREADVNRGWGKYFSKKCKAVAQSRKHGGRPKAKTSKLSKERRFQILCEAHDEGRISDEYFFSTMRDEYEEFMDSSDQMDAYHYLDVHPFSSEGLGQD